MSTTNNIPGTEVPRHSPHAFFKLKDFGFNGNDVFTLLRAKKTTTPSELIHIANFHKLDLECIEMFYELARKRTRIQYDDNEIQQEEINKLYQFIESFIEYSPVTMMQGAKNPISRIEIDVMGETIVMSNALLLDNLYMAINDQFRCFLDNYIRKNYKPIIRRKGKEKGLQPANKVLANKIIRYLESVHPKLVYKELSDIIHTIFDAASNPLPYKNDEGCIKNLKSSEKAKR